MRVITTEVMVFILVTTFVLGFVIGICIEETVLTTEAIKADVAQYTVSKEGKVSFVWKTPSN